MIYAPRIQASFSEPNVPRGYRMTPKGIVRVQPRQIKMDPGSHHKATRRRARKHLDR